MRRDVEIDTYKGTVDVAGLDGSLDLKTYKVDVRGAFDRLGGASRFDTYKGDIEISVPKKSEFDLHADMYRLGDLLSDFEVSTMTHFGRRWDSRVSGSVHGGQPVP